jgi:hypothetical protein
MDGWNKVEGLVTFTGRGGSNPPSDTIYQRKRTRPRES